MKNKAARFLVRVKDKNNKWAPWTGVLSKGKEGSTHTLEAVQSHMVIYFNEPQYKQYIFGIFKGNRIKVTDKKTGKKKHVTRWVFVKKLVL